METLLKAHSLGNLQATYELGKLQEAQKNPEEALTWYEKAAQKKGEIYNSIWGVTDGTEITIPPSIAANCLRWWGYQELGYKPAPRTFEQEINLMILSYFFIYCD